MIVLNVVNLISRGDSVQQKRLPNLPLSGVEFEELLIMSERGQRSKVLADKIMAKDKSSAALRNNMNVMTARTE